MSRQAEALRRLVQHAAKLLAEAQPIPPTSYSDAPRYSQAVAANALALQVFGYVADVIVDESPAVTESGGAWVVSYSDHSGAWVAGSEIDARRIADGRGADVRFVPWGGEVW